MGRRSWSAAGCFPDHLPEAAEEIAAVAGAGTGLRVMLHGQNGSGVMGETFQRAVIKVDVGRGHVRHVVDVHTEPVVLGGNFHMAGDKILDRMVAAVVAELQLGRGAAQVDAKCVFLHNLIYPFAAARRLPYFVDFQYNTALCKKAEPQQLFMQSDGNAAQISFAD